MDPERIRVLLIGNNPAAARLVREWLAHSAPAERIGPVLEVEHTDRLSAGLSRLAKGGVDAVLLDLRLPDSQGLETFLRVRSEAPGAPVVVLTDLDDERLAAEAMRAGAQNYLVKGETSGDLLARSIRHAMEQHRMVQELERRAEKLRASMSGFRNVIASNVDAMIILDGHRTVRFANPAAETLLGRKAESIVGEPFGFPAVVGETTEVDIVAGPGRSRTAEMRVGETEWEGERAILASLRDVTERKQVEAELRQSEEHYRGVVEAVDDAINVIGTDGRYVMANAEFACRTGRRREEILGRTPLEVLGPGVGTAAMEWNLRVLRSGVAEEAEMSYPGRETATTCSVRKVLLRDAAGEMVGLVTVSRDVSERKLAQEQLARAQQVEMAGRVAAQVAHDFRNLLVPLMAHPDLIKVQLPEDHPAAPLCDVMLDSARQMAEISEDMMVLGKRVHHEQQPVDVNLVVRDAVERIQERPDTLVVDLDLAADLSRASGSSAQLLRVLVNLISNAREAMQDAGLIHIRTENVRVDQPVPSRHDTEDGQYIRLSVTDAGGGIPDEIRERIFEPFFTTKGKGKRPGCGLGLSVVLAVVQDHHGWLELESETGRGSTFSAYLPACHQAAGVTPGSGVAGGAESILVVDDDRLQREAATELLRALGYRVELAESGEEALAVLEKHPVDLLVLDVDMPGGMDGAETYRRALELRPGQRAIILSGFARSARVLEAQALGAGSYFRKPVPLGRLARAVREELARVRLAP